MAWNKLLDCLFLQAEDPVKVDMKNRYGNTALDELCGMSDEEMFAARIPGNLLVNFV